MKYKDIKEGYTYLYDVPNVYHNTEDCIFKVLVIGKSSSLFSKNIICKPYVGDSLMFSEQIGVINVNSKDIYPYDPLSNVVIRYPQNIPVFNAMDRNLIIKLVEMALSAKNRNQFTNQELTSLISLTEKINFYEKINSN